MGRTSPTLRQAWPQDRPMAAICVQSIDVQCVLQFTLIHAAGCVLHRCTNRVIHRLELYLRFLVLVFTKGKPVDRRSCWQRQCQKATAGLRSKEIVHGEKSRPTARANRRTVPKSRGLRNVAPRARASAAEKKGGGIGAHSRAPHV